jgi:hypothetical protein
MRVEASQLVEDAFQFLWTNPDVAILDAYKEWHTTDLQHSMSNKQK